MASTGVWVQTRYIITGSPETPSSETLIYLQIGRTRNFIIVCNQIVNFEPTPLSSFANISHRSAANLRDRRPIRAAVRRRQDGTPWHWRSGEGEDGARGTRPADRSGMRRQEAYKTYDVSTR